MDQIHNVITRYRNDGLVQAGREADTAAEHFDHLGGKIEESQGALSRFNQTMLGYLGFRALAGDAMSLARGFVEVANAAEQAQFTISALLQAGKVSGTESWVGAMQKGSEFIAKMRKDAQALPGTFQDLMSIVQPSMLPGLEAGLSPAQIEKLAADMMAVGKLLQVSPQVVGHEMEMLLHGRATSRTPLFAKLSGAMGMEAQDFNKLSPEQRVAKLNEAVGRFGDAIKAYEQTWDAVSSTAQDNIDEIKRGLGAAFFGDLKKELEKVNGYYQEHRGELMQMADVVGGKLASGFSKLADFVAKSFGWIYDHREGLLKIAEVYGATLLGRQLGGLGGGGGGAGGAGSLAAQALLGGYLGDSLKLASVAALGTPGTTLGNAGALFMANYNARQQQAALTSGSLGYFDRMSRGDAFLSAGGSSLRAIGRAELQAIAGQGLPSAGQVAGSVVSNYAIAHMLNNMDDMSKGFRFANDAINVTTSALSTLPGPIGQIAGALGTFYQALNALAGWVDKKHKEDVERDVTIQNIDRNFGDAQLQNAGSIYTAMRGYKYKRADEYGPVDPTDAKAEVELAKQVVALTAAGAQYAQEFGAVSGNTVSRDMIRARLASQLDASPDDKWVQERAEGIYLQASRHLEAKGLVDSYADAMAAKTSTPKDAAGKRAAPVVHITINQEISEAEDADRTLVKTTQGIRRAFEHPTVSSINHGIAIRG